MTREKERKYARESKRESDVMVSGASVQDNNTTHSKRERESASGVIVIGSCKMQYMKRERERETGRKRERVCVRQSESDVIIISPS